MRAIKLIASSIYSKRGGRARETETEREKGMMTGAISGDFKNSNRMPGPVWSCLPCVPCALTLRLEPTNIFFL